jgi:osmotically-inducible protein OsmY
MNTRLNQFVIAAALVSGLIAVLPAQARTDVGTKPADAALAAEVKATPFQDADVDLAVTASHGRVMLTGWVTYANDPAIARKIAASVPGVRKVTATLYTWSSDDDQRV